MKAIRETGVQAILIFLASILIWTSGCVGVAKSSSGSSGAPATSMIVSPAASSPAAGSKTQFTAQIPGASSNSVTWTASIGSITAAGVFTAPTVAGTGTITATSVADPTRTATATVKVGGASGQRPASGVTSVTVSPAKASSVTGGTLSFSAAIQGTVSNTRVSWKASLGTVTATGIYTAPGKAGTDTVTATSAADSTQSSSAGITVTAATANPLVTSIMIAPTTAQVTTNGTFQFASTVQGTATDKSVRWTASLGTINSTGAYTAPAKAGNDTVTAISNADSTKTAAASVSVAAPATTSSQSASCNGAPCPAFPGAAGGGAATVGGRGGVVIEVTNTNDSGTGSLRACVQASGARTCIFRVAGVFNITSGDNYAGSPYLTIACQSAPGEVILGGPNANGAALRISTHDVIVRYCTFSPDNVNSVSGPDTGTVGITIVNCNGNGTLTGGGCFNIITDHITSRWSGNKSWITTSNFTPAMNGNGNGDGPNHSITSSWSLDYEPHEGHPVGFGTATDETCVGTRSNPTCLSVYETDIDFHHDMFVNVDHRIPENSNGSTRWVNNIIYNWSYYANEWLGAEIIDDINNKFVKGNLNPSAQAHPIHFTTNSPEMSGAPSVYVAGNIFGAAGANTVASDQYGTLVSQITGENGDETGAIPSSWERSGSMPASNAFPIVPDPTEQLDSLMLGTVGNSQHMDCNGKWAAHRDAADTRVVTQYQNGGSGGFWPNGVTYTGLSTFPTPTSGWQDNPITNFSACQESLHDGIPDQWKTLEGLSTTDTTLYKTVAPNGYTYLENYLNGVGN
jgi:hypothetical protein